MYKFEGKFIKKNDYKKNQILVDNGFKYNEQYGTFISPEFGAYMYNTAATTIEEDLLGKDEVLCLVQNCHVNTSYYEKIWDLAECGFTFVLGPVIQDDFSEDKKYGVYCTDYYKEFEEKTFSYNELRSKLESALEEKSTKHKQK